MNGYRKRATALLVLGLSVACLASQRTLHAQVAASIKTVAGTGVAGYNGDGIPAASALLNKPEQIAVDANGNLYIADSYNALIRKVDAATGIISTVAGSASGFAGDGGPATSAKLNDPRGIAIDPSGILYISDTNNRRIRKVDATGVISTYAGGGSLRSEPRQAFRQKSTLKEMLWLLPRHRGEICSRLR